MKSRYHHFSIVLAAFCLMAGGYADAASKPSRERAARKACLTGDWKTGVSLLSDLFLDSGDTLHIFNQGRCLEQNRQYEDAIARFEEFLHAAKSSDLSNDDRHAAQRHIEDCRKSLAQQSSQAQSTTTTVSPQPIQATVPAPTPPPAQAPAVVQQDRTEQPMATLPSPGPAQPAPPRSGLRTAGIATASIGGAALIAGLIFNLKNNRMSNDMENTPGGYSSSNNSNRKVYETLGWVGYGMGAACIATGAVLFAVGLRSNMAEAGGVAFVPAFSPGQAGAALKGAF